MSALKAMIKRELQEHKWGFIYLPWIIGAFMSLVVVLVYLGLTEVNTENIKFSTDVFDNQETVQAMNEATFDQKRAAMRAGLLVLGFPLVILTQNVKRPKQAKVACYTPTEINFKP